MASNKKTDGDRVNKSTQWAEVDLRWYFGNGASTAAGDMGLRSSIGGQLEAMHAGVSASGTVNVDAIEMRMARGVDAVGRMRVIETALRSLTHTYRAALRMAFGDRDMRPGVSHVVRLTSEARKASAARVGRIPTETEVEQTILQASADVAWLTKAKAAADAITAAALQAYADERGMLETPRRARMQWEA